MTSITTSKQFSHLHVAQVRGICRLLHVGLKQKGMTKRKAADMAEKITGKRYKLTELNVAANDITKHLKEHYR